MQFKNILKTLILMAAMGHLLFSCITVDKSVGSDYVPESQLLKVKIARFRIPVELKTLDSLQGSSMNYATVGAFNTSEFGIAKFGTAGNVCPNSTSWDTGKDAKIISTYITMTLATPNASLNSSNASTNSSYYNPYSYYYDPYSYGYGYGYGYDYYGYGGYYGYGSYYPSYSTSSEMVSSIARTSIIMDPSQNGITQNFHVYRLKEAIDSTQLYTNSLTEENYIPVELNTSAATYFGGDSISFYISNEYGEELLKATEEEKDSLKLFVEGHGGLYITCDSPMNIDAGRLNLFSLGGITVNIKYNFQPTWDEGLERKDTTASFAFGYGGCLNTSSYSSKHLETTQQLEKLPIEGVAGINPYVNMNSLKDTLDKWAADNGIDPSKILISKATMIFPFEFPDNLEMLEYRYPTYLFPAYRAASADTTVTGKYYYPYNDYNL
ncbi:MAG: hypothetical protein IKY70_07760, partial [Bacteroidales bacterium]|nr:hypothetical protein [Bacteroidales bacterium]